MVSSKKSRVEILKKSGITELNPMQVAASKAIKDAHEVLLLSPTGSGKTLAFLLPILELLDPNEAEIQAMILVPSRELAIQIEQVIRDLGSGYKTNAVYGGRSGSKERQDISHRPAILIGTPGRMADHLRRDAFAVDKVKILVLDEFDKSLEVGFSDDMREIIDALRWVDRKILTSATQGVAIPPFMQIHTPTKLDFLDDGIPQLAIKVVMSAYKDKLDTLYKTLCFLQNEQGIIFCNFKDSIQFVSEFLKKKGIEHGIFHGDMDQIERERSLIKFRNGTVSVLLATDLAARGIDIPELKFIIHFQLPNKEHEFTHRNGRTARMNAAGTAYVLLWDQEKPLPFVQGLPVEDLQDSPARPKSSWSTLFISGGRKDKISKGDIAGLFFKKGRLQKNELGLIEVKNDCAFVAVHSARAKEILPLVSDQRLKEKKIRVTVLD